MIIETRAEIASATVILTKVALAEKPPDEGVPGEEMPVERVPLIEFSS